MKIMHCCLASFYIDRYGYQENILPVINQKDGHDVYIVASTETMKNGDLSYLEQSRYETDTGIPIVRLPYANWLPHTISRKLRIIPGFKKELDDFSPDVIMFHSPCSYELITAAYYKKAHPGVRLYVDSHEAYYNSAQNFVSRNILHKCFYRSVIERSRKQIDKMLYIGLNEKKFISDMYGFQDHELEFFPLGGEIVEPVEKQVIRNHIRKELGIAENEIVFIHSGKLDRLKRTEELLRAFSSVSDNNFKLLIAGCFMPDTEDTLKKLIESDKRIKFLGWKNVDELSDLICASDMYLQPGSVSATLQKAICCGCPVMIFPHEGYIHFIKDNCIYVKLEQDMVEGFLTISKDKAQLENMVSMSYRIAYEVLDYRKLAKRLYF